MKNALVIVPARMQATRLPGKPMADIHGEPMIVHVWRRAIQSGAGRVVVATDSDVIVQAIGKVGGEAVMTRHDHASGSDRVFETLQKVDSQGKAEIIINLQGDLPTLDPWLVEACAAPLGTPGPDIATIAAEITDEAEKTASSVVKVVGTPLTARRLRALYFTRATAPWGEGPLYHHIGIYAYRRAAIERFVALPPSPLEMREKLEQLRALEAGMRIDVAVVDTVPLGVDTLHDLDRARQMLEPGRSSRDGSPELPRCPHSSAVHNRKDIRSMPSTTSRAAKKPVTTKGNAAASRKISYQGEAGANSHIACQLVYPDLEPMPCPTFEDALAAVKSGEARYAMIPIENSLAGRVADIHHMLPNAGLYIIGEYFLPIRFQLMALKGTKLTEIKDIYSHVHALGQCRNIIRKLGLKAHVAGDTAGAARQVSEWGDKTKAALAPRLAATVYDLDILAEDVEDEKHNTTRFVILSAEPDDAEPGNGDVVTTFLFRVRNVPAALYKAMGGFATNGVNMTKLESYQVDGSFTATVFFADIEGHPADRNVRLAMEELSFFSTELKVLGTYPASPFRHEARKRAAALAKG